MLHVEHFKNKAEYIIIHCEQSVDPVGFTYLIYVPLYIFSYLYTLLF